MSQLEDFFRDFALSRGMVIKGKRKTFVAERGPLHAAQTDAAVLELFVAGRDRESSCSYISSSSPVLNIQIAPECLKDYLTLLYHDTYDFTHFAVRRELEKYQGRLKTSDFCTVSFKKVSLERLGMVVNCFYPREETKYF